MDVKEVVRENRITRLPDSPDFVKGIMNLRGIVVPVISVKTKLGFQEESAGEEPQSKTEDHRMDKMIIVTIDEVLIGFQVDSLERVFSIDSIQIQAPEKISEASTVDRAVIEGVVKQDDSIYLILDIKRLLDVEEKNFIRKEVVE